jgi:hypothetical protein
MQYNFGESEVAQAAALLRPQHDLEGNKRLQQIRSPRRDCAARDWYKRLPKLGQASASLMCATRSPSPVPQGNAGY